MLLDYIKMLLLNSKLILNEREYQIDIFFRLKYIEEAGGVINELSTISQETIYTDIYTS